MSGARHTPGPWQINGSHFYGPDPERKLIGQITEVPVIENLERIVACINACEGLNPDAIADVVALSTRMADAYEILCGDTGKNYHHSASSVYSHLRAALNKARATQ